MVGKELIVDVENIEDYTVLKTIEGIKPLMEKIIETCELNVVGKCEYQFSPFGATMLFLLKESHLTIHTYVEERACSINLYTCNNNTDFIAVLDIIYTFFKHPFMIKKVFER